jgi:hypothetical protein
MVDLGGPGSLGDRMARESELTRETKEPKRPRGPRARREPRDPLRNQGTWEIGCGGGGGGFERWPLVRGPGISGDNGTMRKSGGPRDHGDKWDPGDKDDQEILGLGGPAASGIDDPYSSFSCLFQRVRQIISCGSLFKCSGNKVY